jgi:hypothetical protein
MLFQIQFLQAFDLTDYDENKINTTTESLYDEFKDNDTIIDLINKKKEKLSNVDFLDDLTIFRTYFAYDTFFAFHSILVSLINKTDIDIEKYNILIN